VGERSAFPIAPPSLTPAKEALVLFVAWVGGRRDWSEATAVIIMRKMMKMLGKGGGDRGHSLARLEVELVCVCACAVLLHFFRLSFLFFCFLFVCLFNLLFFFFSLFFSFSLSFFFLPPSLPPQSCGLSFSSLPPPSSVPFSLPPSEEEEKKKKEKKEKEEEK
jgi:hypothetical protein